MVQSLCHYLVYNNALLSIDQKYFNKDLWEFAIGFRALAPYFGSYATYFGSYATYFGSFQIKSDLKIKEDHKLQGKRKYSYLDF